MSDLFYFKDFEYYLNLIKNDVHFKYCRYNDGELIAIIGKTPNNSNCDGHTYFPEMSIELKNCLLNYKYSDNYILESFDYWYELLPHVKDTLNTLKIENPELTFLRKDFIRLSHEQTPDKFLELLELLKTKKIVIVGPKYLNALNKHINFIHIEVPLINSYLDKERIIDEINRINNMSTNNYYLFSASMPTNIIIDKFKDDLNNTYINWGSVWDTFFISEQYSFIRKRSSSNFEKYKIIYNKFLL